MQAYLRYVKEVQSRPQAKGTGLTTGNTWPTKQIVILDFLRVLRALRGENDFKILRCID